MLDRYLSINLVFLTAVSCSFNALAAEIDFKFITGILRKSDCRLSQQLPGDFSDAMDRLAVINAIIAEHARKVSYQADFALKCDLANDSEGIYYMPSENTIHLRQSANSDWKTSASLFHEFLHFVGVRIDPDYHAHPQMENIVEVDNVYACHIAVFPQIAAFAKIDSSRLPAARARCAGADLE